MSFETATLESLCELVVDCPHSTPEWTDEGIIVLRNQNIKNGVLDLSSPSFTNEDDYQKRIKRAVPRAGDIVFTREAPMGEVCMVPEGLKCCLGQRQVLLRPKSDVNGQYLFWALQSPYVQQQIAWNEGTGSTVSNVRIPVLKALNIPRIGNEDMIAKSLTDIASKLSLNTQTNQTLEQMAQAIFKSWFVDFDPVKAKMNGEQPEGMDAATASLFPEKLVESELGLIPEGWEPKRLKDILELAYGKALKKKDRVEGDVPVYGSGGLTGYHNQSLVDGPGIIVGRKGTVGSVYWEPKSFYPIDTVFYVKPKAGYSLNYCYLILQNLGLENMNTDAAVPGLNRNNAYRLEVVTPSQDVLNKFESLMHSFQSKVDSNNAENSSLETLRDTLLPKLLSGEITLD
ncbi:restriction modification system DNA specificity subunit [Vibrio cholerae]|nr:restriction endonuclease subunit S [Vibrio cholerae]GHZ68792.1 restriction modification system DNA specificity subunit [Vibrio cholerae]